MFKTQVFCKWKNANLSSKTQFGLCGYKIPQITGMLHKDYCSVVSWVTETTEKHTIRKPANDSSCIKKVPNGLMLLDSKILQYMLLKKKNKACT